MTSKHARLAAAVADAMAAQGFTQKQVGIMGGVTASAVCAALNQGVGMKEERWRMICEGLGLDYDQIVSDVPEKDDTSSALRAPSPQGEGMECASEQDKLPMQEAVDGLMQKVDLQKEKQDRDNLFLLAMYAEGRLAVDIEAGMKVDPMKLWGILDALKKIKDSTLSPE